MIKSIKEFFLLLAYEQRKKIYKLQILIVLMTLLELVGIASIIPFMSLLGDINVLQEEGVLSKIYIYSGMESPESFTFVLGFLVLISLTISSLTSIFTTYKLSMFASYTGTEIADRLYQYYMHRDWIFHTSNTSASLTKQIANEAQRVTTLILMPLMQINSRIVFSSTLLLAIFLYNPYVAIVGIFIFTLSYFILFKTVRKRLHSNGKIISETMSERYKLMNEGFGGIKETLLLGRQDFYVDDFRLTGQKFAKAQGLNIVLAQGPKYLMELMAFGSLIALVLFLFKFYDGNLSEILPVLSVYALASFKLLPAFQQIYAYIAQIRGNISAFEAIKDDLNNSQFHKYQKNMDNSQLIVKNTINLNGIFFKYPQKEKYSLEDINLNIKIGSVVGVVGSSGSGKSTMIDLLLGLLTPEKGQLLVDDVEIHDIRKWQDKIGFVSQSIFLSQGSIAENIAFGIPFNKIDLRQIEKALKMSHLTEMVNELPSGINTKIGERGVQLSGGQRQRIGIARALYHDAEILVFDEATSALDGITEKIIMDEIKKFIGKKTIIMIAHRIKTIEQCDVIFVLESGKIVDSGNYKELMKKNEHFNNLAKNT
jgi:ATP-binding cassette, subfamily B, bacterial PglK